MKTGEAIAVDSPNQILSRLQVSRITTEIYRFGRERGGLLPDLVLIHASETGIPFLMKPELSCHVFKRSIGLNVLHNAVDIRVLMKALQA